MNVNNVFPAAAVFGVAGYFHAGLRAEQRRQPHSHDGVVVYTPLSHFVN